MDLLALAYEGDYAALAEYLEERLSSYIPPQLNPPLGVPAESFTYFPRMFSGNWPVLAASELPPEPGRSQVSETDSVLASVRVGVRVYHPSLTRGDLGGEYIDGREAAKRITRRVFSAWLSAFEADHTLHDLGVGNLTLGGVDMGDHDRIGNPFFQPGTDYNTILWVHSTEVRIGL